MCYWPSETIQLKNEKNNPHLLLLSFFNSIFAFFELKYLNIKLSIMFCCHPVKFSKFHICELLASWFLYMFKEISSSGLDTILIHCHTRCSKRKKLKDQKDKISNIRKLIIFTCEWPASRRYCPCKKPISRVPTPISSEGRSYMIRQQIKLQKLDLIWQETLSENRCRR